MTLWTVNQIRIALALDPVTGGDHLIVPKKYIGKLTSKWLEDKLDPLFHDGDVDQAVARGEMMLSSTPYR